MLCHKPFVLKEEVHQSPFVKDGWGLRHHIICGMPRTIRILKPMRHCFPITANMADNAEGSLSFPPWEGLWIGCSTEAYSGLLLFCLCLLMFHLCILLDLLQSVIAQVVHGT